VMVIYPEGVWYAYKTQEDVDEIIETHLVRGERVTRLMLEPTDNFPEDVEKRKVAAE
jgi:(2Fe-2S) ferredoxin